MKQVCMLLTAALLIFNASCKKHDTGSVTTIDSTNLYMHLHTNLDTNEVESYSEVYETGVGRKISATVTQLYISHIQLIKTDGSTYDIHGRVILKTQEVETYSLGKVPVGTYKSVRFHVGLDDVTNSLDASANADLNHSEMWYNAASQPGGYIYLLFGGTIDTTTNAMGTEAQMQPFSYKLGTTTAYKEVDLPDHSPVYDFKKDIEEYIHLTIDYNKLFNGIQLNDPANLSITTVAANSSVPGTTIINNIPYMFTYEQ